MGRKITEKNKNIFHLPSYILHRKVHLPSSILHLFLWGDPTKAKAKLGWNPAKTSFEELVKIMVESDVAKVAAEGAAHKVRTNLAEYLEKGIVK